MTYSRLAEPPACQSPGSSRTARPRANEYSGTLLRAGVPSVSIDEPEVPGDLRQAPGHQVVHSVRYVARPRNQRSRRTPAMPRAHAAGPPGQFRRRDLDASLCGKTVPDAQQGGGDHAGYAGLAREVLVQACRHAPAEAGDRLDSPRIQDRVQVRVLPGERFQLQDEQGQDCLQGSISSPEPAATVLGEARSHTGTIRPGRTAGPETCCARDRSPRAD